MSDLHEGLSHSSGKLRTLMIILACGIVAGFMAVWAAHTAISVLALVGLSVLVFLAAFASGAFFGFLFGVPQVLSGEGQSDGGAAKLPSGAPTPETPLSAGLTQAAAPSLATTRLLRSNTNLEKISNWLTTLIVGATLTQLSSLDEYLSKFRDFLGTYGAVANGNTVSAGLLPAVGPIILIFGAVTGFLFMYLNTRLVLVLLFNAIERLLDGQLPSATTRAISHTVKNTTRLGSFRKTAFGAKPRTTIDDALALMLDLLYRDAPGEVVEIGATLSNSAATARADYWFYLAAAFGQLMKKAKRDTPEWNDARDNALDCAQRAVAIAPLYRNRLWSISDPGNENGDTDLSELRDDPTFLRIVGQA